MKGLIKITIVISTSTSLLGIQIPYLLERRGQCPHAEEASFEVEFIDCIRNIKIGDCLELHEKLMMVISVQI